MKKILKNCLIYFIIISILIIISSIIWKAYENEKTNNQINDKTLEIIKIQENCEHDWVIVSKYNIFTNGYKTYSKCSKCGKEVK